VVLSRRTCHLVQIQCPALGMKFPILMELLQLPFQLKTLLLYQLDLLQSSVAVDLTTDEPSTSLMSMLSIIVLGALRPIGLNSHCQSFFSFKVPTTQILSQISIVPSCMSLGIQGYFLQPIHVKPKPGLMTRRSKMGAGSSSNLPY